MNQKELRDMERSDRVRSSDVQICIVWCLLAWLMWGICWQNRPISSITQTTPMHPLYNFGLLFFFVVLFVSWVHSVIVIVNGIAVTPIEDNPNNINIESFPYISLKIWIESFPYTSLKNWSTVVIIPPEVLMLFIFLYIVKNYWNLDLIGGIYYLNKGYVNQLPLFDYIFYPFYGVFNGFLLFSFVFLPFRFLFLGFARFAIKLIICLLGVIGKILLFIYCSQHISKIRDLSLDYNIATLKLLGITSSDRDLIIASINGTSKLLKEVTSSDKNYFEQLSAEEGINRSAKLDAELISTASKESVDKFYSEFLFLVYRNNGNKNEYPILPIIIAGNLRHAISKLKALIKQYPIEENGKSETLESKRMEGLTKEIKIEIYRAIAFFARNIAFTMAVVTKFGGTAFAARICKINSEKYKSGTCF